jgi:plastocyanin
MHTIAVQLAPILAAEKSKVPFYIAGGLLVVWALLLSLGVGTRRPDFPRSLQEQRGVMAITAVLVLAALVTAVATSGGSTAKSEAAPTTSTSTQSPASSGASTPTTPTATTGTPTPPSSPAAGASSLSLAADPAGALAYNTKQLSAKAGAATITMTNASPVEHNVTIAEGTKVLGATPGFIGGAKTLKVTLKPGKYTFYCSVTGHRAAGMEGTLTVS